MKSFFRIFLLASVSIPGILLAQFDTATVLGTVRDSSGALVPNVLITLKQTETGITSSTHTDEKGDYQVTNIRIGTYQITAEREGFSKTVVDDVTLTINARQRVDFSLTVGAVAESVNVSGAVQLLETDTSERGQVIDSRRILNLPLNGRSQSNLALLAPGVLESNVNGLGTVGREGSFNVNGLRSTANNFLLDGVDNNQYGSSNQGFSNQVIQVSPDAVAEFKVQTSTYSAEYGRSGGAIINATYRSGTNDYHGSLWQYHRNTALNAVGFFKPTGGVKPPLIRNQFGGTVGGRIIRDRTFFFADYEGFRQVSKSLVFTTIPSLTQRAGVLTVPVTNPLTGQTFPAGKPIEMTPFARKVLSELPAPNVPGATGSNYQRLVPAKMYYDKANIRLDHRQNDRISLFTRIGQQKNNSFEGWNIDGPSGGNQNGRIYILAQQLVGGMTYVQSGNTVWEARLGISRVEAGKMPPMIGGPSMQALYGITGLSEDPSLTGGLTPQSITGFTQLGRQSTNPQFQNPLSINPRVGFNTNRGRHSLKLGFEYLAVNMDVQDTNPLYGLDSYSGQFSKPAGVTASNNQYNLADFMFGARNQYELATLVVAQMQQRAYYAYLQDDFKVHSKLTLNLGVRYEFVTPYTEANNKLSNYDPVTNTIMLAKDGSLYDRALTDPDRNNFAPRFGFAYSATDRTVIRGGYGIGFTYFNRIASAGLLGTNYPIVTRGTLTQSVNRTVNGVAERTPICTGSDSLNCFRPTQAGYPTDLPNTVILYIPRDTPNGYVQNWQFSIQQRVMKDTTVDLAYVGNHGLKQVLLADFNQARVPLPGENVNGTLDARRPIKGFGSISTVVPGGFSNYHALQVKFEHRSSLVNFLNSFTWSKSIDNVSQVLEEQGGSTGTPQDIYNLANDRGLSGYDVPLLNVTSAVWEVPVGKGKKFGAGFPSVLDGILGGWKISGMNTMRSGRTANLRYITSGPTPVTSGLPTFLGGVTLRPNLLGDPMAPESTRSIDGYFNKANVVAPPATQPFGNAGRNIIRGYPFYQLDLGLQKQFDLPMGERSFIEFRAEAFNLFNKTNFGGPNADLSSSSFGLIRSAYPARQLQFAARLVF